MGNELFPNKMRYSKKLILIKRERNCEIAQIIYVENYRHTTNETNQAHITATSNYILLE